ncbi:hypothetical protein Sked_11060 [Sanguibacter keddieii DSM 10542]|uniref:Mycothiol-dependent maleylpyruvate isomerase metal-binding domain-containing protein n=1 Tax=Sanguibacter keddieii (strain ATCC 51767 / DSM 10542 / NCFB 3025 / ST-74) TaxID=446469 RepID=D1BDJ0_SANKS|nr:maleylpyruvate isomerase N-terminal domain-containing protein [Sanguibacter keddieii]ACZ21052.1 hypothetical protein Sked_11060 [Sanguibacter keddieii DSM 10542]
MDHPQDHSPDDSPLDDVHLVAPAPADRPSDADDVLESARWFSALVRGATSAALDAPAGDVEWSCWRTAEHVGDDMLAYALQLASGASEDYLPLLAADGGDDIVRVDPSAGPEGLADSVEGLAVLLASQVRTSAPSARAFHPHGTSDACGFAAMGVVELLVHGYDVGRGLGVDVGPASSLPLPAGPAGRAVARLFQEAPRTRPEAALLWCTGRIALPGVPRRDRWRWDSSVR